MAEVDWGKGNWECGACPELGLIERLWRKAVGKGRICVAQRRKEGKVSMGS